MENNLHKEIVFRDTTFQLSLGSEELNMSADIPENGEYEPWLTKYIEIASNYYGADKDAIDIGANMGIISLILATLQTKGKVISFEPLSVMYEHLQLNLKNNNIHNIITQKKIISHKNNKLSIINVPSGGTVGGSFVSEKKDTRESVHTEKVRTITLDSYLEENAKELDIKIVKIDVECWEKYVLKGARKTLQKHQPITFIEFNIQNRSIEFEKKGKELYDEITDLFTYVFLIDRLSHALIYIESYADLRGLMLTGHFVEDLICFNDTSFYNHLTSHIIQPNYTCYHAASSMRSRSKDGLITSLSHFPDKWICGHNFFLLTQSEKRMELQLTFENHGPHRSNKILIANNNKLEEYKLRRKPFTQQYTITKDSNTSIYVFIEKTFQAKDYINSHDPRELGVKLKVVEIANSSDEQ